MHLRYTGEEVQQRGEALYAGTIRTQVEIPENIGRIVSIDIETGDFEVGEDLVNTGKRMLARHSGAVLYAKRIGYDAVVAVGGALSRTDH